MGAETGRDGIHGASGLASRTFEAETELRPTVQVGNPFLEKILIESCLEALATGWVSGIQDLGAAGLTSAAIESVARGGRGLELDLSNVHRREAGYVRLRGHAVRVPGTDAAGRPAGTGCRRWQGV